MRHASSRANVSYSIMRALKDLYFSIFVVFYKYSADHWSADMNAMKGVTGISIFQALLAFCVSTWVEIFTGQRFKLDSWLIWMFIIPLWLTNYYYLVTRGSGVEFEKRFASFERVKRNTLYALAVGFLLVTTGVLIFSTVVYRQAFHIR